MHWLIPVTFFQTRPSQSMKAKMNNQNMENIESDNIFTFVRSNELMGQRIIPACRLTLENVKTITAHWPEMIKMETTRGSSGPRGSRSRGSAAAASSSATHMTMRVSMRSRGESSARQRRWTPTAGGGPTGAWTTDGSTVKC